MAKNVVDKLVVEVSADVDRLNRDMDRVDQRVTQSTQRIGKNAEATGQQFSGMAQRIISGFAIAGAIEGSLKAGTAAIQQADVFAAMFAGDMEKAAEAGEKVNATLKSLPFGVGALAGAVEGLVAALIGLDDTLAEQAEWDARLARQEAAMRSNEQRTQALRRERNLLGLEGRERIVAETRERLRGVSGPGTGEIEELIRAIGKERLSRFDEAEAAKAAEQARGAAEALDVATVQRDIAELKAKGLDIEAQIRATEARFNREIAAAESDAVKALLIETRDFTIQDIRNRARKDPAAQETFEQSISKFTLDTAIGGFQTAQARTPHQRDLEENTEDTAINTERIASTLERIESTGGIFT